MKTGTKAYDREWDYNVYDCRYCLYWKGNKTGCTYKDGCCCDVPQNPIRRNGKDEPDGKGKLSPVSECEGCPYGRAAPCIGWCTKEVMRAVGLSRERDGTRV